MSAEEQNKLAADYIMANIPGAPRGDGAGDCAVRLLAEYWATIERYREQPECADEDYLEQIGKYRDALAEIMNELGVPFVDYPVSVVNAYEIAKNALG